MRSNPRSINGRTHLFVMLDISPRSDLGAPLPFVTGNPRFSRCSCTEYSSYESRARGWSDLCRVSLLHALQRRARFALPGPGPTEHRPRPMCGAIRKEHRSLLPQSVLLSNLQVCSSSKMPRASCGKWQLGMLRLPEE